MNIKDIFISRFQNGTIIEVDFNQIEVVVAAYLSQDPVLIQEVSEGVDIHKENAKWSFKVAQPTNEQRQMAKAITFGILYGAGKFKISMQVGNTPEEAQDFIDKFYRKYQQLRTWHDKMVRQVITKKKDGMSEFEMSYGKKYVYKEHISKKGEHYLNTPDIKNYPVQGLAADILKTVLGDLYRQLFPFRDCVKLINTVHDSIMFDVREQETEEFILWLEGYFSEVSKVIQIKLLPDFTLPLRADIKLGSNWRECNEY